MKIAITGASGFIGAELVKYFAGNYPVVALQRKQATTSTAGVEVRFFDLQQPETFTAFNDADVLIHAAFIKSDRNHPDAVKVNIDTCLQLAELCKQQGKHFIFLSTMSAHEQAQSDYGKHKWQIEQRLKNYPCTVLKLGLVIGSSGGLFYTIRKTIAGSGIVPLVDGGNQPIQTIHISEVCKAVENTIINNKTGTFLLGTETVYTLKDLYQKCALQDQRKVTFISLPYAFMYLMLTVADWLRVPLPVSRENLLGLKNLKAFDTRNDLKVVGISPLSLDDAIKVS